MNTIPQTVIDKAQFELDKERENYLITCAKQCLKEKESLMYRIRLLDSALAELEAGKCDKHDSLFGVGSSIYAKR